MAAPIPSPFLLASHFLCFLAFIASCQTPPVSGRSLAGGGRGDPISDGVGSGFFPPSVLRLPRGSFPAAGYAAGCEATYGFLPCTTTALGNLFLIIVYGYLMFLAATFLSNGCELLLQILGPGIIGGLFLPVLGALPDAMLILVSGISGSKETAQSQVSVGMGLLAGSTVMLLTVVWGTCVIVGKCDIQDSTANDSRDTVGLSLTGSGITTDIWTSHAAKIMVISVVPFIIVQAPQLLHSSSLRHLGVLIALVVSVTMLIAYCVFQVFQPWIQKRHIAFVKQKRLMAGFLSHLKKNALGRLLTDDGRPNISVIEKLFDRIDGDSDQRLSRPELLAFMVGVQFEEIDLNEDDAVENVMKDFDTSSNDYIEKEEFRDGIVRWIGVAQGHGASHGDAGPHTMRLIDDFHEETKREHDLMVDPTDTAEERIDNPGRTSFKAISLLLLGTAIAAVFADPLVDAVDNFSTATSIPSFFISFIALPFATNSSEAVSAVIFASRKTRRTASLTFSELYGAATLNNVLCLSVFLALVYVRGLTWDFSAEVLIILIVCAAMGGFGSFCTTFRLHAAVLAICLYPLSIALVYVLDYVWGWS